MRRPLAAVLLALTASAQTYSISTFAGGALPVNVAGKSASLYGPTSVAVDKAGNVFFADGSTVLRLDAATGVLTLVAGNGTPGFSGDDGPATSAQLRNPLGVAVDSSGNLYIADAGNGRIRRVSNGVIATVAGGWNWDLGDNGPATGAGLYQPTGIAVDSFGSLYIADSGNERIRKVSNGVIATVAGNGTRGYGGDNGPATSAQLCSPTGVAVDSSGSLYIADSGNGRIRKVTNGVIATVAGTGWFSYGGDNGPATGAGLRLPQAVAVDPEGNLYIADSFNSVIRKVSNGVITTVAGGGQSYPGDKGPATGAQLGQPVGIAVDPAGNLYIADCNATNAYLQARRARIRKVSSGVITTVAGNGTQGYSGDGGPPTSAEVYSPQGVAVDSARNVYISDIGNHIVRRVSNGMIATVAGDGTWGYGGDNGPATSAQLSLPCGIAVDSAGSLYIADVFNQVVRKVTNGVITTVAGGGASLGDNGPAASAKLREPQSVAVDSSGNLYIADAYDNRVRKVSNGAITTVAGNGLWGYSGDNGPATSARMSGPVGVAVDSTGNLYIVDAGNFVIRKVTNGVITTVAANGFLGQTIITGPATGSGWCRNQGIAVDSSGDLYIANDSVRKVSNGAIATVAGGGASLGDNGPATSAEVAALDVAVDPAGIVYIADNYRVRILTPGAPPAISPTAAPVQPGSWLSLYGTNLASGTFAWNGDFPLSLGVTSVSVDGKPAFLRYVSPTQINLQVPDDAVTGPVSVVVFTAFGTAASSVTLAPYGPSFSLLGDGKHVAAEIATPTGTGAYGGGTYDLLGPSNTFSFSTRPVKAGETLVLYGVGFGPTSPRVPAGQPFTGAAPTTSQVTVSIGGVPAPVAFSGLTMAGLYQINVTVPQGVGSGDQPLVATVGGVQTSPGPVVSVQ